jgi:hypothetical protein
MAIFAPLLSEIINPWSLEVAVAYQGPGVCVVVISGAPLPIADGHHQAVPASRTGVIAAS